MTKGSYDEFNSFDLDSIISDIVHHDTDSDLDSLTSTEKRINSSIEDILSESSHHTLPHLEPSSLKQFSKTKNQRKQHNKTSKNTNKNKRRAIRRFRKSLRDLTHNKSNPPQPTKPEYIPHTTPTVTSTNTNIPHHLRRPKYSETQHQTQEKIDRPILYEWCGDTFDTTKSENTMRLLLLNPNGFAALTPNFGRANHISKAMKDLQINVACLSESKINPHSPVTNQLENIFKSYHPDGLIHHANTNIHNTGASITQSGGTTSLIDCKQSKTYNGITYDYLGRWHTVQFITKESTIKIYTVYRTCPEPNEAPDSCWHHQNEILLTESNKDLPENQIVLDLKKSLQQDLKDGHHIIVTGDMNETLTQSNPSMSNMLRELGLLNVMQQRIDTKLPPTHHMSQEAIDHIWVTPSLHSRIIKAGIAPKLFISTGDHRGILIDIDLKALIHDEMVVLTPYERRRLKSSNIRRTTTYNEKTEEKYDEENVDLHLKQLDRLIANPSKKKEAQDKLDFCDNQLYNIHISSEKQLSAIHTTPWSPQYQEALDLVHDTANIIRYYKNRSLLFSEEQYNSHITTALQNWKDAKNSLKLVQENATDLREQYLDDLAHALYADGKFKSLETSGKVVRHIEAQRKDAKLIRNTIKRFTTSSLNYILIPAITEYSPNLQAFYKDPMVIWNRIEEQGAKDIKNWISISRRSEMEELLLGWQCLHYTQSHDTPLASETWESAINQYNSLDDLIKHNKQEYNKLPESSKLFLKELYNKQPHDQHPFEDMTFEDFKIYIEQKKEKTSTSPSGRHLGHFKAALKTRSLYAIFKLIKASIKLNYIPKRWRISVSTLIEKIEGSPKIHKLRTIHIIEPEVQFISNFYWTKRFLPYCDLQENFITDSQYGGRKDRLAHSATVKQLCYWDICRMYNKPIFTHLADARANFDRNLSHIVRRALLNRNMPQFATNWYQTFLNTQEFLVRTGHGVSERFYKRSKTNRIFGDGQGISWASINQVIISTVCENAYRKKSHPFSLKNHDGSVTVDSGNNFFIDDRLANTLLNDDEPLSQLIEKAQHNETLQTELLNAAGGAQAPNKGSSWLLVRKPGTIPFKYESEYHAPGRIKLRATPHYPEIEVTRNEPHESKKYLGPHISPTYNTASQFKTLRKTVDEWASRIGHGHLTPELVLKSALSTLYKQIEFPLIASNLSFSQCNELMQTVRKTIAQHSHYHSKVALEVTHGPIEFAGLQLPHFYDLQGQLKIQLLRYHLTPSHKRDTISDVFHINFSNHMLWLGSFDNFFNKNYNKLSPLLMQTTWMSMIWQYLHEKGLKLEILSLPKYKLPRENDVYIMDLATKYIKCEKTLLKFNYVRYDLQLLSLSDIILEDGHTIHPEYLKKYPNPHRKSTFYWGRQDTQIPHTWRTLFANTLSMLVKTHMLDRDNHLGKRTSKSHQENCAFVIDENNLSINHRIYKKEKSGLYHRTNQYFHGPLKTCMDVEPFGEYKVIPQYIPYSSHSWKNKKKFTSDLKSLWGFTTPNSSTLLYLAKKMQQPFIVATDGGCPPETPYGTYSYVFADEDGNIFYKNFGVSPTHLSQRAPMRFEAIGQLAAISLINKVETVAKSNNINLSSDRTYSLDNDQIASLDKHIILRKNFFKRPHSDVLYQLYDEWHKSYKHPDTFEWVQSHQDSRKRWSDLSILERLNVHADRLCHKAHRYEQRRRTLSSSKAPFFPKQNFSIYNKTRRFISEKSSQLNIDKIHKKLKNYIKYRNNISSRDFKLINWNAVKLAGAKATSQQRITNMKVVHQKWITLYEQFKCGKHPTGICPLCKSESETQLHVLCCPSQQAQQNIKQADQIFYRKLLSINTPAPIAKILLHIIHDDRSIPDLLDIAQPLPTEQIDSTLQAISDQIDIGYQHLSQGFLAKSWNIPISQHAKFYNIKKFYITAWEKQAFMALVDRSQSIWRARCKIVSNTENTYLHHLRMEATKDLLYYKSHKDLIGSYKSVIKYNNRYFLHASKRTILRWRNSLTQAIKQTKDTLSKQQHLLTKFYKINRHSKKKTHTPKIKLPKPRIPYNAFISQFPRIEHFFSTISHSPRPPPEPDP